jgi:hypothetical protein
MRIHHQGGTAKIPVRGLREGERVAGTILTMFKRTRGTRPTAGAREVESPPEQIGFARHDSVSIGEILRDHQATGRPHERASCLMNSKGDRQ